jgi:hypothetical protein
MPFLTSAISFAAGNETGHGGGIVMDCFEAPNIISNPGQAVLLDRYEADRAGLKPRTSAQTWIHNPAWPNNPAHVRAEIDRAFGRLQPLNPGLAAAAIKMLPHIQGVRKPVPDGKSLPPPPDTLLEYLGKGCKLAGAFRFNDDSDFLEVDDLYFDILNEIDEAALWVHEAIYKVLRDAGQSDDSLDTRKIVGYLFSEETIPSVDIVQFLSSFRLYACSFEKEAGARSFEPFNLVSYKTKYESLGICFSFWAGIARNGLRCMGDAEMRSDGKHAFFDGIFTVDEDPNGITRKWGHYFVGIDRELLTIGPSATAVHGAFELSLAEPTENPFAKPEPNQGLFSYGCKELGR